MGKLQSCVQRYVHIAGLQGPLRPADTPFTADLCKGVCDPVKDGPWIQCPFCETRSPEDSVGFGRGQTVERKPHSLNQIVGSGKAAAGEEVRGALADDAASLVMQLLFAARVGRFDLLRIVGILA